MRASISRPEKMEEAACFFVGVNHELGYLGYLPLSVEYAVWTGIGMVVLKEPASAPKIICIALIAAGIIGLNLTTHEG